MQVKGSINEQPISINRRVLDFEDYVDILRRHRGWIVGPTFLGLVMGVVVAFLWPDTFVAAGQIRVVPPQVPTRLVAPNVSEEMSQRVNAIYQGIVSRPTLNNLITTYNLYPDKRKRMPIEDVIEAMRKDILIGQLRGMSGSGGATRAGFFAFSVSYAYSDRRVAKNVCVDLISRFMEESTRTRSSQSQMTTGFFQSEVDAAKAQMDEADTKIAAFKSSNAGALPDEAQALLVSVSAVEQNIQSLNMNLSRAAQEKIQLEAQLRFMKDQLPAVAPAPALGEAASVVVQRDDRLDDLDREFAKLNATVATLRETYTESHPDVQRALGFVNAKKKERDQYAAKLAAQKPGSQPSRASSQNAANQSNLLQLQSNISRLQAAVQAKDMEIEDLNRQLDQARVRSRSLQSKVDSSPLARSNFMALMRDRDNASQRYNDLTHRLQESSMATDIENRRQGETLEVLEQPVIPTEPSAPKRPIIVSAGLIIGLLLGVGFAFGRELKDVSLKSLKDVRAYTKLTVLGSIPLLENDFVVRRRRRMSWLGWSAAFLMGVLMMSGSIIYYYTASS